ncbi:hypothetical protein CNY89_14075 [Amaricoccus sp. HAR-UPW-R2A-40]|nr:hypothetical protein CNY89_14075 [Amaricoccus sp. HAR-UPW-R2A-40]
MPCSCAILRASASRRSSHSTPSASSGFAISYLSGLSGRPNRAALARIQSGRDWPSAGFVISVSGRRPRNFSAPMWPRTALSSASSGSSTIMPLAVSQSLCSLQRASSCHFGWGAAAAAAAAALGSAAAAAAASASVVMLPSSVC